MKKIITFLVLSCWCLNAVSATLTVCPSGCGYTSIAAAVAAASNGDIIYINYNGTITENGILINKSLTIKGNGKTTTIIQAAASRLTAADRVFNIPRTQTGATLDDALTVTFQDMTIQNGFASNQTVDGFSFGGGVQVNNGNGTVVSFTNVVIKNCDTRNSCATLCSNGGGAGIYVSCTSNNTVQKANTVRINLTNCTFDDNNTGIAAVNSSGSGQQGGAICMNGYGTLTAKQCIFTNNTAYTSGAVMYNGAAIEGSFTDCSFESNNVTQPSAAGFTGSSFSGSGGAFYLRSSIFAFRNCMFKNNSSPNIGGAVTAGPGTSFVNCTFYGNSSQYGGAVYRVNNGASGDVSTVPFINCTFAGNTASIQGRAIVVGNHGGTTTVTSNIALINTIVATNSGAAPSDIFFSIDYSRLTVNQKNYVNSVSATAGTVPTFDYSSGNSTLGLAASPANNGGLIETMALDNTSTLVDKGTNNVPGYAISVKDARNYSRTDAGVDIGAYEKAGIIDDAAAPTIAYTPLANTTLTTNRTLSTTITDVNGVYPWTTLIPRIYFKKDAGGAWQSTAGVLNPGTGRNGTWTFTIDNSLMGGVVIGNQIYYYVIAQDVSTTPTIVSEPSGVIATDVNTVTTPPGAPNSYLIGSACADPTVPTLGATASSICAGGSTTLSISTGTLNDATAWKWYSGSCGGTAAGSGTSISVSPTTTTTYYARGEGGCVTPGTCASITITVTPVAVPSVSIASSDADNKICAGASVTFTPTPTNGGTTPAYQWKVNGTNASTGATYTTSGLANNDEVTVELTSNAVCASPLTATSNAIKTTVDAVVVPSVSIASSDADNKICAGTSVTFTPTPTNGGTTPAYQWKVNGTNASTSSTFTTTTLANNDDVTVVLTSNALCAAPLTATSNSIKTTVDAVVVPSLSISSSDADNKICAGASVTFTPTPTNGGTTPAYQWKVNGTNASTGSTFTTTTLANNDDVTAVLTSNALCASPLTATSNSIKTTVDPVLVPSVSISSSDADNKICAGASVTFTPTPTNGGTTPAYQWKVNGTNASTGSTFTTTTLANNDDVTVVLTSNALCAAPLTATSNSIKTTVDAVVVPSVSIVSSDADNKICAGASVTFTPTPTNGGTTPAYQWKVNGTNASTSSTFTTTTLANNDQVTVVLTSNALCASPLTATSNSIKTTVDPVLVPTVSISSSDADNKICAGASVTFTPTPTNGGTTPTYQWKVNGTNASTASTFTTTTLANNDDVTVVVTSNALCAAPLTATSNSIKTTVDPVLVPSVTIASSDADNKICAGTSVTFTPTPVNGGATPSYQWKVNGANVSTGATYTTTTLANSNVVTVVLTSNALCASPLTATSAGIATTVDPILVPSVTIAADDADNEICVNTPVTFTPTPTNGGAAPTYQWKVNGTNASTGATFTTAALANNDQVTAVMTSNALCAAPLTATSNAVKMKVDLVLIPAVTIASNDADNIICEGKTVTFTPTPTNGGTTPTYEWKVNGNTVSSNAVFTSTTLVNGDVVSVVMTSSSGCASPTTATSNSITIKVNKPSTETITKIACDSYTFNNQKYTSSGTYTVTLVNTGGCDSVVTLQLTINKSNTAAMNKTACDSYSWNGQTYTSTGTYLQTFKNTVGCDSVVTLNLTVNHSSTYTFIKKGCDSIIFNQKKYIASGTYTDVLKNKAGCDSTVTLQLTIHKSTPSLIVATACDKYVFNNKEYKASGLYRDTLVNSNGCDSLVRLKLTINHSSTYTLVKLACDSFKLGTMNYTASGIYNQVIPNHTGCDSTVTLNLTVNHTSSYTLTQKGCDLIIFNNKKYTASGTYADTLKNKTGCDSLVTLHLTINHSNTGLIVATACDKYVFNNKEYTTSGLYRDTLVNVNGCDSVIRIKLTVNHSTAYTWVKTACNSFTFDNQTYTLSGTYTHTIKNAAGCDSVVTLQLTIRPGTNTGGSVTATACDKYILNSQTYTSSGTYTQVLQNAGGCDSVVVIHLTINHSSAHTLADTACDHYALNGQVYTVSGSYTQMLKNAMGCDSLLTLNLIITHLAATVTVANNVLTASPAGAVYQWLDCNADKAIITGATSQTYTAPVSGMYAVRIELDKCIDTSACYSVIVTGLEELYKQSSDLFVYPNPNRGSFTLQSKTEGTFYLVNELGQSIQKFVLNSANNYTVKVENVGMGIYFIQGGNTGKFVRHKLVVTE